jgi:hypothetical protein
MRRTPLRGLSFSSCALAISMPLFVACGGDDDGGGTVAETDCDRAAELCVDPGPFEGGECSGDIQAFAGCLVELGSCNEASVAECEPPPAIELRLFGFSAAPGRLDVVVDIANRDEPIPVPVDVPLFLLEDTAHNLARPRSGACFGGALLAVGGSETCDLTYALGLGFQALRIVYLDPDDRIATVAFPDDCVVSPETTVDLCADGCDNDDDTLTDCEDIDCCGVSACSESPVCKTCLLGPEDSIDACYDQCDNDGSFSFDCDDIACCRHRFDCPEGSACDADCLPLAEDFFQVCSDGCDNDSDLAADCDDTDCCSFLSGCPPTTACGAPPGSL